jgi:hypothetical protein
MRILLVSQMYPGPTAPDLGVFVKQIADELEHQGHELERIVVDRRGGTPAKYAALTAATSCSRPVPRPRSPPGSAAPASS